MTEQLTADGQPLQDRCQMILPPDERRMADRREAVGLTAGLSNGPDGSQDSPPASPSAYHRKLAEALLDALRDDGYPIAGTKTIAAVLAAEGVVDPECYKMANDEAEELSQQLAALRERHTHLGECYQAVLSAMPDNCRSLTTVFESDLASLRQQLAALRAEVVSLNEKYTGVCQRLYAHARRT